MKILIVGGSGLIGSALILGFAENNNHQVYLFSRNCSATQKKFPTTEVIEWNPENAISQKDVREPLSKIMAKTDVMINLAGSSIANGRLDNDHVHKVKSSRLLSTNALLQIYHDSTSKPKLWLQASAIGYYGECGEDKIIETSPVGNSILSEVCQDWERTLMESKLIKKTRLCILRIGMVISKKSPAWKKILLPIKMGVGGRLGQGNQWYSWIHMNDAVEAILFLTSSKKASGVFNLTTPTPVRQIEMVKLVSEVIGRHSLVPTPAFVLRAVFGKLADELILTSCRVFPEALEKAGFRFQYPDLSTALKELL